MYSMPSRLSDSASCSWPNWGCRREPGNCLTSATTSIPCAFNKLMNRSMGSVECPIVQSSAGLVFMPFLNMRLMREK